MVSANKITYRMPLAELEARGEWQILTAKQQAFLRTYIQSGVTTGTYDTLPAVLAAYGTTVEKNAKIFSYEILANPKIDRILNLHFGWNEQDKIKARHQKSVKQLLRIVRFQLRHTEPGSTAAQRLTSQLQSLLLGTTSPEEIMFEPTEPENPRPVTPQDGPVPPGCRPVRSKKTRELLGYITPSGERVVLNIVEVAK